ncbi:hypothetical protein SUGI_1061330 [Cryptomeria japonica]|nr:hypothetical protein SUGI_1061330 [Cryptomeria japonica]
MLDIPKETIIKALPVTILEPSPEFMTDNPKLLEDIPGVPVPAMPSGWRPGMPIELPPMPPGWKAGDPVPTPPPGWKPGDAVVLPKPQEQMQVPPMPIAPAKPIVEAIQVPFVQLDINPDSRAEQLSTTVNTRLKMVVQRKRMRTKKKR